MATDFNRYQACYETLPFEATQVKFRKRKMLEHLSRLKPLNLLEVGCGLEPLFLDFTGFQTMTIVEPGQHFYQNAIQKAAGRPGITVHQGTLQEKVPDLGDAKFDCVVMSSLLHEVPDPNDLLQSVRPLCSAGTTLLVNVPNANSFHRRLALEMGIIDSVYDLSVTQKRMQGAMTFDVPSLTSLLNGAGFEVVEAGTFFIKPFTHAQMEMLCLQGVISESVLDGLYAMSAHLPDMGSEIQVSARLCT